MLSFVTRRAGRVIILTALILLVTSCASSDGGYDRFIELGKQRSILSDPMQRKSVTDGFATDLCSEDYPIPGYVTVAKSLKQQDPTFTTERGMVWFATVIDAYCPEMRPRIDEAARRAGVTLPPQP